MNASIFSYRGARYIMLLFISFHFEKLCCYQRIKSLNRQPLLIRLPLVYKEMHLLFCEMRFMYVVYHLKTYFVANARHRNEKSKPVCHMRISILANIDSEGIIRTKAQFQLLDCQDYCHKI